MAVNSELLVSKYIELRDKVASMEEEHKAKLAPYKEAMAKVEQKFLEVLTEMGSESIKTSAGTAYITMKRNVTVADRNSFVEYIKSSDDWDLLTVQANKTAVEAYRQEHDDIPPGLNWREVIAVNIRRS